MAITLFAGSLRYLGLSQSEASEMLDVPLTQIKDMSSGRKRVPVGIWADLSRFGQARDAEVARLRPYSIDDANFVLASLEGPPPGFPCADSYVTMLAAAMLTSGRSDHDA